MTQTQLAPFVLNDSSTVPAIGLGAFGFTKAVGIKTITTAIENGYRLIDTAVGYGNEAEVGEALRRSGIERDLVQITTKLPGRDHGYDIARRSIQASRTRIGVEQIDLHLIHWPIPQRGRYVETWRALVDAQRDGEVRSIGVSNFTTEHLQRIIEASGVVPAVNQIEMHPHFPHRSSAAPTPRSAS